MTFLLVYDLTVVCSMYCWGLGAVDLLLSYLPRASL